MRNNVPINCSCPNCGNSIIIPLHQNKNENYAMESIMDMLKDVLKIAGTYTFMGELKCSCDNTVIACLTVSAQTI